MNRLMTFLAGYVNQIYASLRIVTGFLFSIHGAQKILGLLADSQPAAGSQIWFGGLIELIGGVFVMVGLKTRWAAFVASGTMAVAYVQFHWEFQFGKELLPIINRGELALLYCFVFLFIAARGGVIWCFDKKD